jgi:hypothetical protein
MHLVIAVTENGEHGRKSNFTNKFLNFGTITEIYFGAIIRPS